MRAFADDRYAKLNDVTWVREIERYLAAMKPAQGRTSASGTSAAKSNDRDRTEVVPSKSDLTPFKPSIEVLDDNTQRAHDRDQGVRAARSAAGGPADAAARPSERPELADEWKRMDRNGDNLISPQEMREALDPAKR